MVGVWVQVEGPFMAGPSDSGSVRTHLPIHGPQRVVVSSGRRSRHDGRCRLPRGYHRRNWSHTCAHATWFSTWLKPQGLTKGRAQAGRPLRAGPLAEIGPSHCHASSQCRAARVDPPYAPWLATMIDRSKAGPLLGVGARSWGGWPSGLRGPEVGAIGKRS